MPSIPDHAIRVLISHCNELIQSGLTSALDREDEFSVHRCGGIPILHHLCDAPTDRRTVVVSDYQWAIELLERKAPGNRCEEATVVVVGGDSEREVREALSRGARGYLTTDCSFDEVAEAVREASMGKTHLCRRAAQRIAESLSNDALTARENDVLQLVAKGLSNKSIARLLDLSVGTVKCHVRGLMAKLRAENRTHAVVVAERRGLIPPRQEGVAQADVPSTSNASPASRVPARSPGRLQEQLAAA
jgi:DNA-binding NarL/FixJ family response regulator